MNGRLRKAGALFASLAILGASAVTMLATPASAAPSDCETGCSLGYTASGGPFNNGPFELGVVFSVSEPGNLARICYPVAPGDTGTDTVTLWGVGSAPAVGGCGTIAANIAPGTYTASFHTPQFYLQDGPNGASSSGGLSATANSGVYSSGGQPTLPNFSFGVDVTFFTAPNDAPVITDLAPLGPTSLKVTFTGDSTPGAQFTVNCVSATTGNVVSVVSSGSPTEVDGLGNAVLNQVTCTVTEFFPGSGLSSPISVPVTAFLIGVNGPGSCASTMTAPTKPTSASEAFPGAVVSWAPATSDPAGCIAGYIVTPSLDGVAQTPTLIPGNGTTTLIRGLTLGSTYTFTVAAENGQTVGPESDATAPVTIGTPAAASAVTAAHAGKRSIKVTFKTPKNNGARITMYAVTCRSSNGGAARTKFGKSSPITVTGLTAGKSYTCVVRAANKRGVGAASRRSAAARA